MSIETYMLCEPGGRKQNQDFTAQIDCVLGKVLLVCDGMGGNSGGGIASQCAANYILDRCSDLVKRTNVESFMQKVIEEAHKYIIQIAKEKKELSGMMTTIVMAIINSNKIHVAHAGDSRFLLIRDNKIFKTTLDHSYVQELVNKNELTLEQALFHEKSNLISNGLGSPDRFYVDIMSSDFYSEDIVLLLSDGVTGVLPVSDIVKIVNSSDNVVSIANSLLIESERAGSIRYNDKHDNIGIVVAKNIKPPKGKLILTLLISFIALVSFVFTLLLFNGPLNKNDLSEDSIKTQITKVYNLLEQRPDSNSIITIKHIKTNYCKFIAGRCDSLLISQIDYTRCIEELDEIETNINN